jgi:DNA-binding response OmpR family regulator
MERQDFFMTDQQSRAVLVVEDDAEINALVGAYAQLCGFNYLAAMNGTDALAIAKMRQPSLVVLDVMLPDLDGFEVCTRLKADDATRSIPVIMLTALSGEQTRERGRRCGAIDYLTKPFDPDHLMDTIARHAAVGNSNFADSTPARP